MIEVKVNIDNEITAAISDLQNIQQNALRAAALDVLALMTDRIHNEGKDSKDTEIGTYSSSYLRRRQQRFSRSSDNKVIMSLTRQLENDYVVVETDRGQGITFNNPLNLDKANWNNTRYGAAIFEPSTSEIQQAEISANNEIERLLNNK